MGSENASFPWRRAANEVSNENRGFSYAKHVKVPADRPNKKRYPVRRFFSFVGKSLSDMVSMFEVSGGIMSGKRNNRKKRREQLQGCGRLKNLSSLKASLQEKREALSKLRAVLVVQEAEPEIPKVRYFSLNLELYPGKKAQFNAPFNKEEALKQMKGIPDDHEGKMRCLNLAEDLLVTNGVIGCDMGSRYSLSVVKGSAFDWDNILEEVIRVICWAVFRLDPKYVEIRRPVRSTTKDPDQKNAGY